jgi:fructose-1,6-bisphosphatase/sedoheptulose 1,7-bisphosphatase-like protein
MVNDDLERLWTANDLCKSDDALFAASGVCDGYLPGVIIGEDSVQTFAELIDVQSGQVSRYDRTHPL